METMTAAIIRAASREKDATVELKMKLVDFVSLPPLGVGACPSVTTCGCRQMPTEPVQTDD
jgi:hypothetical protein